MGYYYNAAGQRFNLPERPLEPPEDPIRAAAALGSKSQAPVDLDEKELPGATNTEQLEQTPNQP